MTKLSTFSAAALAAGIATLLVACGGKSEGAAVGAASAAVAGASAASAPARSGAGAAVSVTSVVARQRELKLTLEAIGSVTPVSSVDVKPQLSSVVTRVHVQEGQFVRAGQLLFTLDSRPDEANVAKMRAQLAKDEAALADAQRQWARSRDLLAKNFISQGALDTSQAQV
ncbi:MAG: efflux RND transporter periplasmic adaptor subunit, partial [Rhodoferax sp.]